MILSNLILNMTTTIQRFQRNQYFRTGIQCSTTGWRYSKKNITRIFGEDQGFLADRYIKGECPRGAKDQHGDPLWAMLCYLFSNRFKRSYIGVFRKPPVLKSSMHYLILNVHIGYSGLLQILSNSL